MSSECCRRSSTAAPGTPRRCWRQSPPVTNCGYLSRRSPKASASPRRRQSADRFLIPRGGTKERGLTRSEEHTSELQSRFDLVCRLLLEKKKIQMKRNVISRHA